MVRYHEDYLVSNKGGLVGALNIAHSLGRRSLVDKLGNIITAVRLGGQDRSILRISWLHMSRMYSLRIPIHETIIMEESKVIAQLLGLTE